MPALFIKPLITAFQSLSKSQKEIIVTIIIITTTTNKPINQHIWLIAFSLPDHPAKAKCLHLIDWICLAL